MDALLAFTLSIPAFIIGVVIGIELLGRYTARREAAMHRRYPIGTVVGLDGYGQATVVNLNGQSGRVDIRTSTGGSTLYVTLTWAAFQRLVRS